MRARREFLKLAGAGVTGAIAMTAPAMGAVARNGEQKAPEGAGEARKSFRGNSLWRGGRWHDDRHPAINRAIEAAEASGGGTVYFAAGQYLCYSIRLKSNVALHLDQGAVIIAADPLPEGQAGGYDEPEPAQPWEAYQDYGHNHWHNSLIWGEDLHDISIYGPGRIWGRGLTRSNGPAESR